MNNDMTPTPADVRERAAMEVYVWEHVRRGAEESWARQQWQTETDGVRDLYFEAADRILAILRTARGEGEEDGGEFCDLCGEEFDPSELGTVIGPLGEDDGVPRWYRCPRCARAYDAGYQQGQRDPRGDETADPTAPRSDAQGEDQWEDLIFGTLVEAYNEAHAARRSEGGSNGLE